MAEEAMEHPQEMSEGGLTEAAHPSSYRRFGRTERFEHIILLVTFSGLALTGIPQRYAAESWAKDLIALMGGIESIRIVHRILATVLMAEAIYHGGIITYKIFVLGRQAAMLPGVRDIRDVIQWIAFNLGLRRDHPHLPRYNFGEKVEYLAVVWGTIIMVATGFMLWNPIATTNLLPGQVIPAARTAHSAEALLAVLSIITWHMYNVHIRRFNRSMFTGKISRDAMEEEHGEELEAIDRGEAGHMPPPEVIRRRNRYFIPYAFIVATILILGLIWFVTFEQTAIPTIEPVASAPESLQGITAADGDPAIGAQLWVTQDCGSCHGDKAQGGVGPLNVGLANTALPFEDFVAEVRRGPADMAAYSEAELSTLDLAHIYAWLHATDTPASE